MKVLISIKASKELPEDFTKEYSVKYNSPDGYENYGGVFGDRKEWNYMLKLYPKLVWYKEIELPSDDLKQYMTNLLYYAHTEAKDMDNSQFDKWVEEMINGIDEYLKSQLTREQIVNEPESRSKSFTSGKQLKTSYNEWRDANFEMYLKRWEWKDNPERGNWSEAELREKYNNLTNTDEKECNHQWGLPYKGGRHSFVTCITCGKSKPSI